MIDEIDLSMVESMVLFTYRVNGRWPGFHPEIFEVVRKDEQFLLQRRYGNETTAIPAEQIVRVLEALPKAEPITSESNDDRSFVCSFPGNFCGIRLKIQLCDGRTFTAQSNSGERSTLIRRDTRWRYGSLGLADQMLVRNERLRPALGNLFKDSHVLENETSLTNVSAGKPQIAANSTTEQESIRSRPRPKRAGVIDKPLFELDQAEDPDRQLQAAISSGANINSGDRRGRTPLDHAIRYEKRWLVGPLLERGADPSLVNDDGESVLQLACRRAKSDEDLLIIEDLLHFGGDANECVHAAFVLSPLRQRLIDLIISYGADVDTRDEHGRTGLMCNAGSAATLTRYIQAGANANASSEDGITPLMLAVYCPDCLRLLIDAGASVNDVDRAGRSPLIHAVLSIKPKISSIQHLLKSGADPHIRDNSGMRACDYASRCEEMERLARDVRIEFGFRDANCRTSLDDAARIHRLLSVATPDAD